MRILTGKEEKEALKWFDKATELAGQSLCLRVHFGAVIVKDDKIIGAGFNSPPQNDPEYRTCLNEYDIPAGFRHDRTCCIHAEQRAILDAIKNGKEQEIKGARIYAISIDNDGNKIKAKDVKCTICSREVLDAGISEFALYFEDGVQYIRYSRI